MTKLGPGLIGTGAVVAIVGGVAWASTWKKAEQNIRVDEYTNSMLGLGYGSDMSMWTGGVVASVVILVLGVLLMIIGLIGVVVASAIKAQPTAVQTQSTGPSLPSPEPAPEVGSEQSAGSS